MGAVILSALGRLDDNPNPLRRFWVDYDKEAVVWK